MGCFYIFKEKLKLKRKNKSTPISEQASSYTDDWAVQKHMSKSSGSVSSQKSIPSLYEERGQNNLRVFGYKELRNATNDFSRVLKIGEGGFGSVYKGLVKPANGKEERIMVAIKKLNQNGSQVIYRDFKASNVLLNKDFKPKLSDFGLAREGPSAENTHVSTAVMGTYGYAAPEKVIQGHKQWLAEVQFLGVVEHPNLVKLIEYCAVDGERGVQRLLVYEFMANMSLEDHLFNRANRCLPWNLRLQIALGAAEGLTYLHDGVEVQIIYRDFKASNVLLNKDFKPKLSDFGLAREGPSAGNTHVSTAVMGTYGYAAPDYVETGHLTDKSDVWSFGVVLYELLTGRKSMDRNRPRNEQKLLDWVKHYPVDSKRFNMIIDPRLDDQYSMRAAKEIAKLADGCLSKNARDRPKMREVVESIKLAMQFKEMDGCVEAVEVDVDSANDKMLGEKENGSADSTRRRMLHLAKMNEGANVVGRRRLFMLMKSSDPV